MYIAEITMSYKQSGNILSAIPHNIRSDWTLDTREVFLGAVDTGYQYAGCLVLLLQVTGQGQTCAY